jgi:exodeoxyribonuclease VII large subunit
MQTISDKKHTVFSVTEVTQDIKVILEANFEGLWVEGEISNLRSPSSGHFYFTLKDNNAQLPAVLFRGSAMAVKCRLHDGLKVLVFGGIDVYEKQGKYQLLVRKIEPKGLGDLQLAFEQLKKKLFAEGLFDEDRKKKLPLLPERIGIVTSPTGAAIRDILNIIERRFSNSNIIINPVRVQGEGAAQEIAEAVDEFNRMGEVDVIIVTRGGGSIEDLWCFNEEAVARAIYRSRIPVVSAVGHEIDYTISDFVADLRCPTPSAAAELVIGKKSEMIDSITGMRDALNYMIENTIQEYINRLRLAQENRVFKDPGSLIRDYQQDVDAYTETLIAAMGYLVEGKGKDVRSLIGRLEALSPLGVLHRGYSVTTLAGHVVRDSARLKKGELVTTRVSQGSFRSQVVDVERDGA